MKILHAADLHLGKRLHELSLKEDQEHVLNQLLDYLQEEKPDALLLTGDIYDKAQPAAETVSVLDGFLTALSELPLHVFIIAGNHDSPSRLAYGARLLSRQDIHIAGGLNALPEVVTLEDAYGPVHFVLLPFFRLYEARLLFPDKAEEITDYETALRLIFEALDLPAGERRVLLSHQHFSGSTPAEETESELNIIGGLEACSSRVLEDFSYAALGHLHRPQSLSKASVRYAGSPLAYSFSELGHDKSFPLVELKEPGEDPEIRLLPIVPLHPMRERKGKLDELLAEADELSDWERQAYTRVILTDEKRLDHPLRRLQTKYPNVLQLRIQRDEIQMEERLSAVIKPDNKDLITLFSEFYKEQTGRELSGEERALLQDVRDEMQTERGQA